MDNSEFCSTNFETSSKVKSSTLIDKSKDEWILSSDALEKLDNFNCLFSVNGSLKSEINNAEDYTEISISEWDVLYIKESTEMYEDNEDPLLLGDDGSTEMNEDDEDLLLLGDDDTTDMNEDEDLEDQLLLYEDHEFIDELQEGYSKEYPNELNTHNKNKIKDSIFREGDDRLLCDLYYVLNEESEDTTEESNEESTNEEGHSIDIQDKNTLINEDHDFTEESDDITRELFEESTNDGSIDYSEHSIIIQYEDTLIDEDRDFAEELEEIIDDYNEGFFDETMKEPGLPESFKDSKTLSSDIEKIQMKKNTTDLWSDDIFLKVFYTDNNVSTSVLLALQGKGLTFKQIFSYLKEKAIFKKVVKLKQDVKVFLNTAVSSGIIKLRGLRYVLTGLTKLFLLKYTPKMF